MRHEASSEECLYEVCNFGQVRQGRRRRVVSCRAFRVRVFGLVRFDGLRLTGREVGWQSETRAKAERDASPQAG